MKNCSINLLEAKTDFWVPPGEEFQELQHLNTAMSQITEIVIKNSQKNLCIFNNWTIIGLFKIKLASFCLCLQQFHILIML